MKPFDLTTVPLRGVNLIEAGAGTGKTYAIAGLYLRLIVEQGLGVDQILVVTYTKAAAEELKSRIRNRLIEAKAALKKDPNGDALIHALLEKKVDKILIINRISESLVNFDRSAIFTIHGFCQRVLQFFAFETGHLFQAELVQDQQALVQEVVDDFWRRYISKAPAEFACYTLAHTRGPDRLAALLNRSRFPKVRILPRSVKPPLNAIAPWRKLAAQTRQMWPQVREAVIGLLHSPGLNARYYGNCEPDSQEAGASVRQARIQALARAMDQWPGTYPLIERFRMFSKGQLTKATKKGHDPLQHPFFDLCQQVLDGQERMEEQMAAYLRYLKIRLHLLARKELRVKKARHNIMFFDDLLLQVHRALRDNGRAAALHTIQQQYPAALVDEFQDTDPLQYDIFTLLFGSGKSLLFMIGDPKQAIYNFRGADVYSYLQAARQAQTRYTLTRNWRSTPSLIKAVNTIFSGQACPFGIDKIDFEPASAARSEDGSDAPALQLWFVARDDSQDFKRPLSQQVAVPRIAAAVAEEIVQLLIDPASQLLPEDIAILTRTHRQAQIVQQALSQRRVPAVLHSAGRVFDAPEAQELTVVLQALLEPGNPMRVRAALATDLLGAKAHDFDPSTDHASQTWERRWASFEHFHQVWMRQGFYRMFSGLMRREGIKRRLLTFPNGERRLTNLLHLIELLHQADLQQHLGPEGLLKWLISQRRALTASQEDQQLRLESDARAVRIITIHKSKGLQFEVVFCPFTWAGVKLDEEAVTFHDPADQDRLSLVLGPGIASHQQQLALKEELAENLRLLYVALTRARRRCYWAWGRIRGAELSAPAYVLHGSSIKTQAADWLEALKQKIMALSDKQMRHELQVLVRRSEGALMVTDLPQPTDIVPGTFQKARARLTHRTLGRPLQRGWRIASFSSLIAGVQHDDAEWPDRDRNLQIGVFPDRGEAGSFNDLTQFPKGVRSGLFFHDLLEHYNFYNPEAGQRQQLVFGKLAAYGFDRAWAQAVDRLLQDLAGAPLVAKDDSFSLQQIAPAQRINEMEFYYPLNSLTSENLRNTLGQFENQPLHGLLQPAMARMTFAPLQGFMKGFIDVVICHEGRYYLVDWKSNYLGNQSADYSPAALARVMAAEFYFLQYHLYAVALDRMLQQKLAGYDYERHFGGVFYIFLRGIDLRADARAGIFYHVPDAALMAALGGLLSSENHVAAD